MPEPSTPTLAELRDAPLDAQSWRALITCLDERLEDMDDQIRSLRNEIDDMRRNPPPAVAGP